MSDRPRILSISFSDIQRDARVLRQIRVLSEFADVTTVGYGEKPEGATDHVAIPSELLSLPQTPLGVALLATRQFRLVALRAPGIAKALTLLRGRRFDAVVANEARALPLANAVAGGAPVWGDMHEWAPEERSEVLVWRLLVAPYMRWVCATYLRQCRAVSTVNASIAELYDEQFGTSARVVRNARPYADLQPTAILPGRVRLAHSGAAIPGREIEALISATLRLGDGFSLDLYLVRAKDQGRYWQSLRDLAGESERIVFHDAVPPENLPLALNAYDVGVFVLPPQTTNHRLMLPNKFFDFVQARLAIVFNSAPETDRLIHEHDLGLITAGWSVDELVSTIAALTSDDLRTFKRNADRAAAELSSEQDEDVQREITALLLTNAR